MNKLEYLKSKRQELVDAINEIDEEIHRLQTQDLYMAPPEFSTSTYRSIADIRKEEEERKQKELRSMLVDRIYMNYVRPYDFN